MADARSGLIPRMLIAFTTALTIAAVSGCTSGNIRSVSGQLLGPSGFPRPAQFEVAGDGVCGKLRLDFGDGTPPVDIDNFEFATAGAIHHSYTGWAGRKTVKADPLSNCVGSAKMIFTVGNAAIVGFAQPLATSCANVSASLSKPPLRMGTIVHITTKPNVLINFGCVFGCVYDADGMTGTDPSTPFPTLRALSMVIRVGTQIVQGGTNVTFTTNQAGPLEICVNDGKLSDNSGAWGITIDVDETGAS